MACNDRGGRDLLEIVARGADSRELFERITDIVRHAVGLYPGLKLHELWRPRPDECPVMERARRVVNVLGITKSLHVADDKCFCVRCYGEWEPQFVQRAGARASMPLGWIRGRIWDRKYVSDDPKS